MAAAVLLVLLPILVAATAPSASAATCIGEKSAYIKLYWHDLMDGPDPTVVRVAYNISEVYFGGVNVIDDPLTEGPDLHTSKLMGRAQGVYIGAGKHEVSLLMNMNFVFLAGEYKGSSIAIFGRNAVFDDVREMLIVGGTGVFRGARGYVQLNTHYLNLHTGDAIIEYNIYIKYRGDDVVAVPHQEL